MSFRALFRCRLPILLPGLLFLSSLWAQQGLVDTPSFQAGCAALKRGDFETAVAEFHRTWALPESRASEFEQGVVASRLVESWYRNGDTHTAVAWFRANGTIRLSRDAQVWIALSLLDSGHYDEAADAFQKLGLNEDRETQREMAIHRARALARGGAAEQAYRTLHPNFPDPKTAREAFFYAGLAHETRRWKEGIAHCDRILASDEDDSKDGELVPRAVLLRARCMAGAGDSRAAASLILQLIETTFDLKTVYLAFDVLMEVSTEKESSIMEEHFSKWRRDEVFPNRKLAAEFYSILINPESNETRLIEELEAFVYQHPNHALSHEARLMLATLRPNLADLLLLDESANNLEELRRHIDFETAVQQFQDESFSDAKETFLEMSTQLEGRQREQALFNSAISALYAGDEKTFDRLEAELGRNQRVASAMHAELMFLAGLYYASRGSPKAFDLLSSFTKNYPDHASVVDAKLALAELHLNLGIPQPQAAREILSRLARLPLSASRQQRLDYAELWAELLTTGSERVLEKATAFLVKWPDAELRPEVSMLLATEFYKHRNFKKAQEAFEVIARDFPDSKYMDAALFFAAKASSQRSDNVPVIENWDQVISRGGRFANHARHEKGIYLLKKDRFEESIRVFDEILNSKSEVDNDLRFASRCDKGYALYLRALALGNDEDALTRAAHEFAEVVRDADVTRAWRYQASVRRGKCLELLGRENVALEIYQSLTLESEANPAPQIGSSPLVESSWLFRAGFAALKILEKKQDWKGAVKLAETLSQRSGTRAIEAARHAERLRLQHFVWD